MALLQHPTILLQGLLQCFLKMLIPRQLIRGLLHYLLNLRLKQLVQLLHLIISLYDILHVLLGDTSRNFMVLLRSLSQFLPLYWVIGCCQISRGLFGKYILYGQYLVKELELLLGSLPVLLRDTLAIKLSDVLEPVDKETFEGNAVKHLVVVHLDGANGVEALNF